MCFSKKDFSLNVEDAYAVQDEITRLRIDDGERVAGYKVGCTGPGTTKLFGMKGPIRGTLFDTEVHKDGVALDARSFCNLAVEAEMGIKIGAQGQILSVFPVIELHNFIFRGPKKSLSELIANNGLNKGMVLSKKSWEKMPEMYKENSVLSLEINGSVVDSGNLWPMDGGPLSSLSWLNANLAKYGLKYCGENIILGGTALGLYHIKPGDTVNVKVNGQSAVKCFVSLLAA
ncbi:hypothetical protein OAI56_06305 [Amylibacter sp.]|nr:hypothetical protein [Amylibacter sp.]